MPSRNCPTVNLRCRVTKFLFFQCYFGAQISMEIWTFVYYIYIGNSRDRLLERDCRENTFLLSSCPFPVVMNSRQERKEPPDPWPPPRASLPTAIDLSNLVLCLSIMQFRSLIVHFSSATLSLTSSNFRFPLMQNPGLVLLKSSVFFSSNVLILVKFADLRSTKSLRDFVLLPLWPLFMWGASPVLLGFVIVGCM